MEELIKLWNVIVIVGVRVRGLIVEQSTKVKSESEVGTRAQQ